MPDMNWREAIIKVLQNENEPVHYADITESIMEQGLKTQVGATPAASVAATLSESFRLEGKKTPFERVARGYYRLRDEYRKGSCAQLDSGPIADDVGSETALINAFGMYWRRELVSWNPPRLLGQQQPGSAPVDFAEQRGVYLLHDRREVIYVGRTTDQGIGERLKQHTLNRLNGRWDRFSWFGVFPVHDNGALGTDAELQYSLDILIATMESLLIEGLEPPQNRKRGDGFSAVEFIQTLDPELAKKKQAELLDQMKSNL